MFASASISACALSLVVHVLLISLYFPVATRHLANTLYPHIPTFAAVHAQSSTEHGLTHSHTLRFTVVLGVSLVGLVMLVKDRAIDEVNRMCEAQALARIPNPVRWYPNVDDADIIQHVVSVHLLHRAFTTPTALPIEDQNHNKFGMGFQGIGYFPNIMSNGNTYSDMIISEVMSSENLPGLRCIYGVREVANVYALYFYYHDVATHAAGLAAGNFSPFHMLDPFSTKKEVKKEVKKRSEE
ncbi:hypothetical protein C8R44DRAFT_755449 [Mycena epipterygia]|nr:hypothetical protein C8R44DRAFT_755449 [Mycena epipterygia]